MKGVRGTDGVAFCWQDKERLRLIRRHHHDKERCATQMVYVILTNLASDVGDSRFTAYRKDIASLAGIGRDRVSEALDHLVKLRLISISEKRGADGRFAPLRIVIAKGRLGAASDVPTIAGNPSRSIAGNPSRLEARQDATTEETAVSGSRADRDGLPAAGNPASVEELPVEDKEVVVVSRARDDESPSAVLPFPQEVHDAYVAWRPSSASSFTIAELRRLIREHTATHVVTAIEACRKYDRPVGSPIPFLEGKLNKERARGYTFTVGGWAQDRGGLVEIPNPLGK